MKKSKVKGSTALATKSSDDMLPSTVPEYIKSGNAEGLENVEPSDIVLPRIKLMQPLSPEVTSNLHKAGEIINSLSGLKYELPIEFIPIMHKKTRMFWQDRDEGNGILCQAPDGKKPLDPNAPMKIAKKLKILSFPKCINACAECPFSKFDEEEEDDKKRRPKCNLSHDFPILIVGDKMPSALSMSRTKLKVGANLLSLAMIAGNAIPFYSMHYKLSSVLEKKKANTYYNFEIKPSGWSTAEEYRTAAGLCKSYKTMNVKVADEHPDGDGAKE